MRVRSLRARGDGGMRGVRDAHAVCGHVGMWACGCAGVCNQKNFCTHSPLSNSTRYCDDISDALSRITSPFSPKHTTTASKDANAILHASHGQEHPLQPSLVNLWVLVGAWSLDHTMINLLVFKVEDWRLERRWCFR